jgi:hypothetical protein
MLHIISDYLLVKAYIISYYIDWMETWNYLDWERIFIQGGILLENAVIIDCVHLSIIVSFSSYYRLYRKKFF